MRAKGFGLVHKVLSGVLHAEQLEGNKNLREFLVLKVISIKFEAPGNYLTTNAAICRYLRYI
jgi:hypothetical protein